MHFIEHIIEPTKLLMAWQSSNEKDHTRYLVANLSLVDGKVELTYLDNTPDFHKAQEKGFESYPAFPEIDRTYHNVLDTFMRRLPPRTRGDLPQYLEGLRLKPDVKLSNFGLLGYSGGRLPSDGFSFVHPFNNVNGRVCELLVEAAGYRHIIKEKEIHLQIGDQVSFRKDFYQPLDEPEIKLYVKDQNIGSINRGLMPTFIDWIDSNRIENAWIEKINGSEGRPAVYVFVKILPKTSE